MILEHTHLDIDDNVVFETIRLSDGFEKANSMPKEACYLQVVQGCYNSFSESERLVIHSNEGILMKCGNYTSRMIVNPKSNEFQAITVRLNPEVLKKVYKDALPDFMGPQVVNAKQSSMTKVPVTQLLKNCLDSIGVYFENPSMATEELISNKLKEVITLLLQTENAPKVKSIFHALFSQREYKLKDIVESHLYLDTTIEELAHLCSMNTSTFKREFKKIFGDSPARYLKLKKLGRAESILQDSSVPLTDVALYSGFADSSHFSKLFKNHFGMAPSKFIQKED